jgi:Cu/Ag efflux protein CusF
MTTRGRRLALTIAALCLMAACSRRDAAPVPPEAPKPPRVEHAFKGKIERIDTTARTLTVNSENVQGWMPAMTMVYTVDNPEIFATIAIGDTVTARVLDGDFATLHRVEIQPHPRTPQRAK